MADVWIDWSTYEIHVARTGMTLVQLNPTEIRGLDINWFRLKLKDIEDDIEGMPQPDTHRHNTEVTLGGITYARVVEILDPYTITFEDGQYAVNLTGANTNLGDKVNVNQVSVRTNNSAGLISSPDIEYASFNGGVMINVNTGFAGTAFPTGTERRKSNNLADALLIAQYRGFKKFYLNSNILLDSGTNLNEYEFVGHSHVDTYVEISDAAQVSGCSFSRCVITGVLDGNNEINECTVEDITFFNGDIHDSGLKGTITLGGDKAAFFGNCSQVYYDYTPIIDMGGWGQDLVMTDYTGRIKIQNLTGATTGQTGTTEIGIGLDHGQVILDSNTVTSGTVFVSGIGDLIDENGVPILSGTWNGGVRIYNKLINRDTITEAAQLGGGVYIDTGSTYTGIDFPIGSKRVPVNNLTDAVTIAQAEGLDTLIFLSNYFFPQTTYINDFFLIGQGALETIFTFESVTGVCIVANCHFKRAKLTGNLTGIVSAEDCLIEDLGSIGLIPASQPILIERCFISGIMTLPANYSGLVTVKDSYSYVTGTDTPILDMGNSTAKLQVRNYTGGVKFLNVTKGNIINVDLMAGQVKLDPATVTSGVTVVRGNGKIINADTEEYIYNGIWNGGVTVVAEANTPQHTAKRVWDEPISQHLISGSTGNVVGISQFSEMVTIYTGSTYSGTDFPIGTSRFPVNNLTDAISIATTNGFKKFNVLGNLVIDATDDISSYVIMGEGATINTSKTTITLISGCTTQNTHFFNSKIQGRQNGEVIFTNCVIGAMTNAHCIYTNCVMEGPITLNNSAWTDSHITDVINSNSLDLLIIDYNGSPMNQIYTNFSGLIKFINLTNSQAVIDIRIDGGEIWLDSTCTDGTITISGIGKLVNESLIPIGNIDTSALVSNESVADYVWDELLTGANHNTPTSAGRRLREIASSVITTGIAVSATTNTIILNGDASDVDGAYDPSMISIVGGTGYGQTRMILEYKGSTKTAVVDRNWKIIPDDSSEYSIVSNAGREHVNEGLARSGGTNTIMLNALASSHDDVYVGQILFIRSGTGEDQALRVTAYNGTTKVATVCEDWNTIPDTTSAYVMLPTSILKPDRIADAVWNKQLP